MLIDLDLVCSHLNSLVPRFNKVAKEQLIDNLRSRADTRGDCGGHVEGV